MTAGRGLAGAAAILLAAALAGCGVGPGPTSEGEVTLTVTRDYGTEPVDSASEDDPPESETVIRLLDRESEITTRYGGGFVQSINGLAGDDRDGRRFDWFFYVNGVESPVGAADVQVRGGDRVWWDYRDWTSAMRVPAVVGSFPEPFAQASAGSDRMQVRVECLGGGGACPAALERLNEAGADAELESGGAEPGGRAIRVLVGLWRKVRSDPAVAELRGGPADTGVFATFKGPIRGAHHLIALGPDAAPAGDLGPGAGLVAALRDGEDPPTWIVTGSEPAAVRRAAGALSEDALHDRYAVAAPADGATLPLPVVSREDSG